MKEPPRDPNTPVIDRLMIGKIGKRRGKRGRKGRVRGKGEGGIY
jgi:hypothetical protein